MITVFSRAPILCSVTALLFVTSLALLRPEGLLQGY